ncbi:MAG: carbon-nitrogen family hydrolase [Acidimicrobiales bacterium]|nr:carbon-nitrogen family hydrolase [Acidimicrobiales bacterium]
MKVAAIQHDIFWEDPAANLHRLDGMIAGAAASGAKLVVFPDRSTTGSTLSPYMFEGRSGVSTSFMQRAASDHGVWVAGTAAVEEDGVATITSLIAGPGGELHAGGKHHLTPSESEVFAAHMTIDSFLIEDVRVASFVGTDLRYPNDFWDVAADVDLFIVHGAEPESRSQQWRSLLAARAIENQCYVVGANRVGTGGGRTYLGESAIIDPSGQLLVSASATETTLIAEVESALVRFTRDRSPLLGEREPLVITLT